MEEVVAGKFSCGGCGKSYKWKPELAGKRAKCKCGHVMTVPAELPGEEENELDNLYALAEEASAKKHEAAAEGLRCPSCGASMMAGDAVCTSCGFNLKTGRRAAAASSGGGGIAMAAVAGAGAGGATSPILGYSGVVKKELGKDEVGDANLTEYYIPCGLIAFGLIVAMIQTMSLSGSPLAFGAAMVYVMVTTVVDLVLMLIACFVAAKIMDASFGSPGPALLKLAGISLAPQAVAATIEYLVPGSTGWFIGLAVALIGYYCLFSYLFDLDAGEVLILCVIIRGIKIFLGGFIILALLALLLGHSSSALSGLGGGGGAGASPSHNTKARDAELDEMLANFKNYPEAKAWLDESANRMLGKEGHEVSVSLTKEFYDAGATKVCVAKEEAVADEIIITLPKDKSARKRIFDVYAKYQLKFEWASEEDEGQKYLTLEFDTEIGSVERAKRRQKMQGQANPPAKVSKSKKEEEE